MIQPNAPRLVQKSSSAKTIQSGDVTETKILDATASITHNTVLLFGGQGMCYYLCAQRSDDCRCVVYTNCWLTSAPWLQNSYYNVNHLIMKNSKKINL